MLVQTYELVDLGLDLALVASTWWHLHGVSTLILLLLVWLVELLRLVVGAWPLVGESASRRRHASQLGYSTTVHESKIVLALIVVVRRERVWLLV